MSYAKTLSDDDLIDTDSGPPYQYCTMGAEGMGEEGCPEEMFAGDRVICTTEEIDGMREVYCLVCYRAVVHGHYEELTRLDLLDLKDICKQYAREQRIPHGIVDRYGIWSTSYGRKED
jgi:hypothetical protein